MSIPSFDTPPGRGLARRVSPLLLIGGAVILSLAIAALAVDNIQKGRQHMISNLVSRADALIWSVEAGTRTWVVFRGGTRQLQALVEETAKQSGVEYIAITGQNGQIIAHSNPELLGKTIHPKEQLTALHISEESKWRFYKQAQTTIFEVYKIFSPAREHLGGNRHLWRSYSIYMNSGPGPRPESPMPFSSSAETDFYIFVGLNSAPFEGARAADLRSIVITAMIVALVGLAGLISIYWAHNYHLSRRQLKDTQAFAAAVVNSLPVGMVTCDPSGRVALVNQQIAGMLGAKIDQMIGAPISSLGGLDWPDIAEALDRDEIILDKEMALKTPRDEIIPVSLSATSVRNEEGLYLGRLYVLHNLTEVKSLQEQVRRNERLSALGSLAAGVAHEIRNPLSSIKGFATYLLGKIKDDGPDKDAARVIIQEVDRLDRVVTELLEFARPERVKLDQHDVNEVIERSLRLVSSDLTAKNIQLSFARDPNLPLVRIDAERLTQALLNLFLNAVQALPVGGRLEVSAEQVPGRLLIKVADDGPGIPPDMLMNIFNPYFTTKPSGTGLGLAIVHRIVEGHGGQIIVDSKPGHGSTFIIDLPVE